jgi:hypothetical protein
MKKRIVPAAILFLLFSSAFTCADSSNQKNITTNNTGNGFAVVELFTSEGCSSCPPADNAVAKLLKEYNNNVYVLGYHVDYWDNLGWKDAFSNADYTKRQKNYARILKPGSVYTPQVIINGEEQFVGSDENKLHASINKDLKENSQQNLTVTAKANNNTINVSYQTNSTNNLNIALIQLMAETQVQRGENHGATLHHVNIVRNFQTISLKNNTGNISLNLPAGLSAKDCGIIAFTQDANMKITSAAKTDIQL